MIQFTIQGEPKGKGRHRTNKNGHTYTPQSTVDYEKLVQQEFMIAGQKKLEDFEE